MSTMELEGDHADGDRVNGGSTMEGNQPRSLIGQLGSGGGRVNGGSSSMERGHNYKRPTLGLVSGRSTVPGPGASSRAARLHGAQARILGRLMAPPAYKLTMKHYCDPSGMTFAVGGAGVYEVQEQLPTLAKQIYNFKRLIKDGSISKWHLADSVALVAISGNDYAHVANSSDISNMIAFIGNVTAEIAANVKRLQKLGVKKVLVNNLHPVGCTPWLTRNTNYTVCDTRGNMAASFHNSYLRKSLAKIRNVHILDLNTAFNNIVNHAPGKGSKVSKRFEHRLAPCCESFDPEGYCGQRGNNSERLYTVCTDPEHYFYWDSVHPTMAGWEAVMKQLQKPMLHFLMHK